MWRRNAPLLLVSAVLIVGIFIDPRVLGLGITFGILYVIGRWLYNGGSWESKNK